jgi:hypothetical protein
MFGKMNSATPLEMLGHRLETNAAMIGSEINARMAFSHLRRG